jgi:predicted transcriptional regulator
MAMPDDARQALLARLIDHAPLFPPASLPLAEALAEDARAVGSPHSWMLGRFVCPASRLAELPAREREISAVLDGPLPDGREVEAVEVRYRDDLDELAGLAPEVYVEVPLDDALDSRLDELADRGLRAKVRCGGAAVPSVEQLAAFLGGARDRGLAFKATAGLHHAVRTGDEHGFLNVLGAVVFGEEERALAEQDPGAFGLDADAFTWRGLAAAVPQLVVARRERLVSIGSCSFFEPVEELASLGLLG